MLTLGECIHGFISRLSLSSGSPASSSQKVVPRGFDGKHRVEQDFFRNCRHVPNSPPEPALGGLIRTAHLKVVGRKFLDDIGGKNLGPRPAPDALRKRIIIWAQFSFDLPRQRGGQSAVSGIRQSVFLKICSEFGSTSHGLQPLELVAGAADQAQLHSGPH